MKQVRIAAVLLGVGLMVVCQTAALAQNLGGTPALNVAVQGQTGAQPEGAFLNAMNWISNVIAPVGAGGAIVGAIGSYAMGRGAHKWLITAGALVGVSGILRLIEFFVTQGTGGIT